MIPRKAIYLLGGVILGVAAITLAAQGVSSLVVTGHAGSARVVTVEGQKYVELDGLARVTGGSLRFNGDQAELTLGGVAAMPAAAAASGSAPAPADTGFSRGFLNAGIEAMSQVREWRSALKNAIESGFPIASNWLDAYKAQARQGLRLASVAASTDADKKAFGLLTAEFNNMSTLSDKYVKMREAMTYIAPDALSNDALDQKILTCARSLGAMASSNQFVDDGSCH